MNTTLPRLGSRVRISFLAQQKPPTSGGFFMPVCGQHAQSKQFEPLTYICPMTATIHTDHGPMTVEFFEKDAPNTVANFGWPRKFYEGSRRHSK